MSEQRKTTSVYLSPRAQSILDNYVKNSGYGSISRTIEEIILGYNELYETFTSFQNELINQKRDVMSNRALIVFLLSNTMTILKRASK